MYPYVIIPQVAQNVENMYSNEIYQATNLIL